MSCSIQGLKAQVGTRLYLRFNSDELRDYEGVRLKPFRDNSNYWVLGREQRNGVNFPMPTALAQVVPSGATATHKHVQSTDPLQTERVGYANDFLVINNDSIVVSCLKHGLSIPANSPTDRLSLFRVNSAFNLAPASSWDYYFSPLVGNSARQVREISAIVHDASPRDAQGNPQPRYVVAFNCFNPAQPTNLLDWGIASISSEVMTNVVWSTALVYAAPDTFNIEAVRDMCLTTGDTSSYAVCGYRMNSTTGVQSGLITKIDSYGNVKWQRQYVPPAGSGLQVEFNCITEFVAVNGTEYVITGSLIPTNNLFPKTIIWLAVDAATGALNWSYRYAVSNGDDCEAFHHTEYLEKNFACAGRITHRKDGHTSGMLMEMVDKSYHPNDSCEALRIWWNYYDTMDPTNTYYLNSELVDVIPKINPTSGHDVAAVGTAEVFHNSMMIKDVLWMDGVYDPTKINPYGHNFTLNFQGTGPGYCRSDTVVYTCEPFPFLVQAVNPEKDDKLNTVGTELSIFKDEYFRNCSSTFNNLGQSINPKNVAPDDATKYYQDFSARIYPNPVRDNACSIRLQAKNIAIPDCKIYNSLGIKVDPPFKCTNNLDYSIVTLDCSILNTGVYTVQVSTDQGLEILSFVVIK